MNAKQIFPEETERKEIKKIVDMFNGKIVKVTDDNGQVLFESDNSYENVKKFYNQ